MPILRGTALAVVAAAVTAGPVAAPAVAAKRATASKPKITRVTPMRVEVGDQLTIRGKGFKAKKSSNTVIFKGAGGRTAFVKPRRASRTTLVVKIPGSVSRLLTVSSGQQRPTRIKLRVLAARKFSAFTPRRLSPVVLGLGAGNPGDGGQKPLAACNQTSDHDGDLLPNGLELSIGTNPCLMDTDGDGIEDGYEYQSAKDLNDDDYQTPGGNLPYPGKRPYPNPLDPGDRDIDYDGDSLTMRVEQKLWRYGVQAGHSDRTLTPLHYSDGNQYSIFRRDGSGRRRPDLPAAGYPLHLDFLKWAQDNGYRTVTLIAHDQPASDPLGTATSYGLLDFNRDDEESAAPQLNYPRPEQTYYDLRPDGYLSDDERDEDADGLTNYDEDGGRGTRGYWASCYSQEEPFTILYEGTDPADPDSDGDGVRDGADDQDHDDIPNVMELSRRAASGHWDAEQTCKPREDLPSPPDELHAADYGRVNPFNPCLPASMSRTCQIYVTFTVNPAPFDDSLDWASLN